MESLIHWMTENKDLCRLLFFLSAVIGYIILNKTRPEFYKNKSILWWIWVCVFYFITGPLILFIGLGTLIFDHYQLKHSSDRKILK